MEFTPLHRALGLSPTPLTDEILDAAIRAGVRETDDLDWKSKLPPVKAIPLFDVPKDIAAMANSGGGMLVYGVDEHEKAATGRCDAGEFDERYERAYRSAAITAISPPVFGLEIRRLGTKTRAVAVIVPASVDGPHLIYRNEYFGAPIRNDADTVWMKERQIEAMYRARFDERRRALEAVDSLYAEIADGRDIDRRAWLIAVTHPRIPGVLARPTRSEARSIFEKAQAKKLAYSASHGAHPLESVDYLNPRPGLRRWTAVNSMTGQSTWREAWASTHHDGSVTLAAAVGGHRKNADDYHKGGDVEGGGIECAVADFAALVRVTAAELHHDEYDTRIGIEWTGAQSLRILPRGVWGIDDESTIPLHRFTPVRSTLNAASSDAAFRRRVYELAEDCVNQGGVIDLCIINRPPAEDV